MDNTALAPVEEPKGIPFFSIKTGETHWCKLEPTISAYINSSDMGINASRDQDYGWRLAPEWVQKVRLFKRDRQAMSILTAKNQGQKPTTVNILYYMYGEELANYYDSMEENENPFEQDYLDMINKGTPRAEAAARSGMPLALVDFQAEIDDDDDIADLIDDEIAGEDDELPTTLPEEPAQPTTTTVDPAKPGDDKTVVTPPKPAKPTTPKKS